MKLSQWWDLNRLLLRAEVIGAAGHVGQRTDKVVAALKWWIQQHCTDLFHFLQPGNTQRHLFTDHSSHLTCLPHMCCFIRHFTSKIWDSTVAQGEGKPDGTVGHLSSCGCVSTQLFPNISISWLSTPERQRTCLYDDASSFPSFKYFSASRLWSMISP